jgi:CRP-like cAMP-binding protein
MTHIAVCICISACLYCFPIVRTYFFRLNRLLRLHRFPSVAARAEAEIVERLQRASAVPSSHSSNSNSKGNTSNNTTTSSGSFASRSGLLSYLSMTKLLLTCVLFCHTIGCCWFLIGYFVTWQGREGWIWADGLVNEPLATRYVRSFFFTLVTVATIGYGGIVARTEVEYIFVIVLVFVGVGMYITLLARLTVSAEQRTAQSHSNELFLQIMRQFLRTRSVDPIVKEKVLGFYQAQAGGSSSNGSAGGSAEASAIGAHKARTEDALLNALPPLLKVPILAPLAANAFLSLPLLADLSDDVLDLLLSRLECRTYAPGDVLSRVGERRNEVCFIRFGSVETRVRIAGAFRTVKSLGVDEYFGSECLLYPAPPERSAAYIAKEICRVFILTRHDFDEQISLFPDDHALIQTKRAEIASITPGGITSITGSLSSPSPAASALAAAAAARRRSGMGTLGGHRPSPSRVLEEVEMSKMSSVGGGGGGRNRMEDGSSSSSSDEDDDENVRNARPGTGLGRTHSRGSHSQFDMGRLFGGAHARNSSESGNNSARNTANNPGSSLLAGALQAIQKKEHARRASHAQEILMTGAADDAATVSSAMDMSDLSIPAISGPQPLMLVTSSTTTTSTTVTTTVTAWDPNTAHQSILPPPPPGPPDVPAPSSLENSSAASAAGSASSSPLPLSIPPSLSQPQGPPGFEKGKLRQLSMMRSPPPSNDIPSFRTPSIVPANGLGEESESPLISPISSPRNATTAGLIRQPTLMRQNTNSLSTGLQRQHSSILQRQNSQIQQLPPPALVRQNSQLQQQQQSNQSPTLQRVNSQQSQQQLPPSLLRKGSQLQRTVSGISGPGGVSKRSSLADVDSAAANIAGGSPPSLLRGASFGKNSTAARTGTMLRGIDVRAPTLRGVSELSPLARTGTSKGPPVLDRQMSNAAGADMSARLMRHQQMASARRSTLLSMPAAVAAAVSAAPAQTPLQRRHSLLAVQRVLTRTRSVVGGDTTTQPTTQSSASNTDTSRQSTLGRGGFGRMSTHARETNGTFGGRRGGLRNGEFVRFESTLTGAAAANAAMMQMRDESGEEISRRFFPNSVFRLCWDAFAAAFLLWFVCIVPFRIAFEAPFEHTWSPLVEARLTNIDGTPSAEALAGLHQMSAGSIDGAWRIHWSIWIDCMCDVFFLIDIFLRMNYFAYFEEGILVAYPPSRIRSHYLHSHAFLLDVCATLVIDLAFLFLHSPLGTWLLYWVRIIRLFRLHRIQEYMHVLEEVAERFIGATVALIQIALQWIVLMGVFHWLACSWYLIGIADNTSSSWLSQRDSPTYALNMHDHPHMRQTYVYFESLYFIVVTMSTVGYGDIQPHTVMETWFSVVIIFLGLVIYAQATAQIASLAANLDVAQASFQRRQDDAKSFQRRKGLPVELRKKIAAAYSDMWVNYKGVTEKEILSALPVALREDIHYSLYGDLLLNSGLFFAKKSGVGGVGNGNAAARILGVGAVAVSEVTGTAVGGAAGVGDSTFPVPFLRRVCALLRFHSYSDGEVIYRRDQYIDYTLLVRSGALDAFELKQVPFEVKRQSVIGEGRTVAEPNSPSHGGESVSSPAHIVHIRSASATFDPVTGTAKSSPTMMMKESLVHRYTKTMCINPENLMVLPKTNKLKKKHAKHAPPSHTTAAGINDASTLPTGPLLCPQPAKQTRTLRAYRDAVVLSLRGADLHELLKLYPQVQAPLMRNIQGMQGKIGLLRQGNTLNLHATIAAHANKTRSTPAGSEGGINSRPSIVMATEETVKRRQSSIGSTAITVHDLTEETSTTTPTSPTVDAPTNSLAHVDEEGVSTDDANKLKSHSWIIARDAPFRLYWDLAALVFVLLYLFSIPVLVAFSTSSTEKDELPSNRSSSGRFWSDLPFPLLVLTYALDLFFYFDFYFHLRRFASADAMDVLLERIMAASDSTGGNMSNASMDGIVPKHADVDLLSLTTSMRRKGNRDSSSAATDDELDGIDLHLVPADITHMYIFRRRHGLILAVFEGMAGLPLDLIALLYAAANPSSFDVTLQLVAILRLGRLLYMARLSTYLTSLELLLERLKVSLNFQMQRTLKLLVMIVLVLHWMSCLWCMLGRYPFNGTGANDSDLPSRDGSNAVFSHDRSWMDSGYKADLLQRSGDWGHYLWSTYWAISTVTTVGYGDLTCTNLSELLLNLLMILSGDIVYGAFIGGICVHAANAHASVARHRRLMHSLLAYMNYRRVPPALQARLLAYHKHVWNENAGMDVTDARVMKELPPKLAAAVASHSYAGLLASVPFFTSCSSPFLAQVALCLRMRVLLQGDIVYQRGDAGSSLYILEKGQMRVEVPQQQAVKDHRDTVTIGTDAANRAPTFISNPVDQLVRGSLNIGFGAGGMNKDTIPAHELQLDAPSIFGEVSFFMGTVRTASVSCNSDTASLLELNRFDFESKALRFFPHYRKVIMNAFVFSLYPHLKQKRGAGTGEEKNAGEDREDSAAPAKEAGNRHRRHRRGGKDGSDVDTDSSNSNLSFDTSDFSASSSNESDEEKKHKNKNPGDKADLTALNKQAEMKSPVNAPGNTIAGAVPQTENASAEIRTENIPSHSADQSHQSPQSIATEEAGMPFVTPIPISKPVVMNPTLHIDSVPVINSPVNTGTPHIYDFEPSSPSDISPAEPNSVAPLSSAGGITSPLSPSRLKRQSQPQQQQSPFASPPVVSRRQTGLRRKTSNNPVAADAAAASSLPSPPIPRRFVIARPTGIVPTVSQAAAIPTSAVPPTLNISSSILPVSPPISPRVSAAPSAVYQQPATIKSAVRLVFKRNNNT